MKVTLILLLSVSLNCLTAQVQWHVVAFSGPADFGTVRSGNSAGLNSGTLATYPGNGFLYGFGAEAMVPVWKKKNGYLRGYAGRWLVRDLNLQDRFGLVLPPDADQKEATYVNLKTRIRAINGWQAKITLGKQGEEDDGFWKNLSFFWGVGVISLSRTVHHNVLLESDADGVIADELTNTYRVRGGELRVFNPDFPVEPGLVEPDDMLKKAVLAFYLDFGYRLFKGAEIFATTETGLTGAKNAGYFDGGERHNRINNLAVGLRVRIR